MSKVDDSKNIPRAKKEDKKYETERTKKYMNMKGKPLPLSTWTLGEKALLYCTVSTK